MREDGAGKAQPLCESRRCRVRVSFCALLGDAPQKRGMAWGEQAAGSVPRHPWLLQDCSLTLVPSLQAPGHHRLHHRRGDLRRGAGRLQPEPHQPGGAHRAGGHHHPQHQKVTASAGTQSCRRGPGFVLPEGSLWHSKRQKRVGTVRALLRALCYQAEGLTCALLDPGAGRWTCVVPPA